MIDPELLFKVAVAYYLLTVVPPCWFMVGYQITLWLRPAMTRGEA